MLHMAARGKPVEVDFLLPPCDSWRLNLGHQS